MTDLFRILWACLTAGMSKLKNLPRALTEAFLALAEDGKTSPVRLRARRKDKEMY